MISISRVAKSDESLACGLSALLIDAVHGGASVGFLGPRAIERARNYWLDVLDSLGPELALWVAETDGEIVGSVQLGPCSKENGRHRADVQKLLVLSSHRGQGVSRALMGELEACAVADGRTLLVLDTVAGSPVELVYRHFRWQKVGEIPEYAAMPDGELRATACYFKRLAP